MPERNCQIVIAEDNPADVMMVRMGLEGALSRFDLKVFDDGGSVLAYLDEIARTNAPCPDVMLLDLNMPTAGGLEIVRRLRSCATCSATPVIIVTSSSHPSDRKEAEALGVAHYFLKPDDFDEFLAIGNVVAQTLQAC